MDYSTLLFLSFAGECLDEAQPNPAHCWVKHLLTQEEKIETEMKKYIWFAELQGTFLNYLDFFLDVDIFVI